jgi:6-phosphofructokinase 2
LIATGGVTGRFVEEMLSQAGVPWKSIPIAGPTRISLTVYDQASRSEYRFVPQGPMLDATERASILDAVGRIEADWLVVSGSLPPGVPPAFYASVVEIAGRRGAKIALDTSGAALKASLGKGIDLLKPSLSEFESIVGRPCEPLSRPRQAVEQVRSGVARMIALTVGGDGAILATADGALQLPAAPVAARTGVGAGDSFLAGLVLGLATGQAQDEALQLAIAAGAVAVANTGTARVRRAEVEATYRGLRADATERPVSAPIANP